MALLADYAITPDVFDVTSYSNASECEARLQLVGDVMLGEGLVRDLRDGEWRALFRPDSGATNSRAWHPRGLELVKKLIRRERLVESARALPDTPESDSDWCAEALAADDTRPLCGGVIVTEPVKRKYERDRRVARIDRLAGASWWQARSSSVTLTRTLADYQKHLGLVLRHSNLLMFVDPHLDPETSRYHDFAALLTRAGRRSPVPTIEIHRVCYEGSGKARTFPMRRDSQYFKRRFSTGLTDAMRTASLSADVFIWNDFHDRYLLSNLVGISLPNGFDTKHGDRTTWSRLGRDTRDDIRREFHPTSRLHKLQESFKVPA